MFVLTKETQTSIRWFNISNILSVILHNKKSVKQLISRLTLGIKAMDFEGDC
ncbi:MAG: hypothetical protein AB8B69_19740 [Chitinophagales bacterium]